MNGNRFSRSSAGGKSNRCEERDTKSTAGDRRR
ncbi:hypothetical protein MUK42_10061 [Musa troglodytarum]|uniref:Uncharacterized protein n=1 Tax=Musa troglodytarum TaxID=320322 RepID=A0A9E7EEP9_9LILI|nr:hypothetical protein MUK42_10061 [Musa troglodytarum]